MTVLIGYFRWIDRPAAWISKTICLSSREISLPWTVMPLEDSSVSVVAPTAMEADALSTAVFVLGLEKGAALVRATRGADALFVRKDGSVAVTDGFPRMA